MQRSKRTRRHDWQPFASGFTVPGESVQKCSQCGTERYMTGNKVQSYMTPDREPHSHAPRCKERKLLGTATVTVAPEMVAV